MKDEVDFYYEEAREKMEKAAAHLSSELLKLRAGKASPQMLEGITVEFYGVNTPLSQAANINTPDARTITIQPWDKKLIDAIEKAIFAANIGLTPMNNGEMRLLFSLQVREILFLQRTPLRLYEPLK